MKRDTRFTLKIRSPEPQRQKALEYLGIDADAKDALKVAKKDDPELDRKIRDFMCQNFYDIRTFGAVMTTFVKAH